MLLFCEAGLYLTVHSDALLVTATLNSAGSLIRSRPAIANKIISAVLTFNPLKLAISSPMAPKTRVMVKSMERTTRAFLLHVMKRYCLTAPVVYIGKLQAPNTLQEFKQSTEPSHTTVP